jgi:hypothetical protein
MPRFLPPIDVGQHPLHGISVTFTRTIHSFYRHDDERPPPCSLGDDAYQRLERCGGMPFDELVNVGKRGRHPPGQRFIPL